MRDILHYACDVYESYPVRDRLQHLVFGLPPFVHAIGQPKPWSASSAGRKSAGLSPYCAVALRYRMNVDEPATWMKPRTLYGRLAHGLALGQPSLRDLPAVLAVRLKRRQQ